MGCLVVVLSLPKIYILSFQLELRRKQFHVLLSTIHELQQTLESKWCSQVIYMKLGWVSADQQESQLPAVGWLCAIEVGALLHWQRFFSQYYLVVQSLLRSSFFYKPATVSFPAQLHINLQAMDFLKMWGQRTTI